jgi:hypothetical protein
MGLWGGRILESGNGVNFWFLMGWGSFISYDFKNKIKILPNNDSLRVIGSSCVLQIAIKNKFSTPNLGPKIGLFRCFNAKFRPKKETLENFRGGS